MVAAPNGPPDRSRHVVSGGRLSLRCLRHGRQRARVDQGLVRLEVLSAVRQPTAENPVGPTTKPRSKDLPVVVKGGSKTWIVVLSRRHPVREAFGPRRLPVRALRRKPTRRCASRHSAARRPACQRTRSFKRSLLSEVAKLNSQASSESPAPGPETTRAFARCSRRSRSLAAIPAASELSLCCTQDDGPGAMPRNA